jgi:hypothetical protein
LGVLLGYFFKSSELWGAQEGLILKMFIPVGCLRGALAPLHKNLPLPLAKGKGIQGMGLPIIYKH